MNFHPGERDEKDPEGYLDRLTKYYGNKTLSDSDRAVYEGGVLWAKHMIAKLKKPENDDSRK